MSHLLESSSRASLHGAPATSTVTMDASKFSVRSKPKFLPHIVTAVDPRIGPEVGRTYTHTRKGPIDTKKLYKSVIDRLIQTSRVL